MKVMWSYDGKQSKTKVIIKDDNKICSECSGYDGHFNECNKLKQILEDQRTKEQIDILNIAIKEACQKDKSHTKELSEN